MSLSVAVSAMPRPNILKRFLLLSHKNARWKVRNWSSTLLEVLLPVILSLLLLLISLVLPPETHPTTQTAAKALPSAGLVPFLQTLYCDLTDTWTNGPDGLPNFKGARVSQLYDFIQKTSSPSFTTQDRQFDSSVYSLSSLAAANITYELSHTNLTTLLQRIALLCKYSPELVQRDLHLDTDICTNTSTKNITALDLSRLDRPQLLLLYLLATLSSSSHSPLSGLIAIREDLTEYLRLIEEMLLFLQAPDIMLCGSKLSTSQSKYIYRFLELILAPALQHPISNDSNNSNMTLGLLDGGVRILFSPNTSLSWSLVRKMNQTFELVDNARHSLLRIRERNQLLQSLLYNLTVADPNLSLVTELRYLAEIQQIYHLSGLGLPSPTQLLVVADMLDPRRGNTPNLWDYTREVNVYTGVLLRSPIFRVSWDFFRGLPTEESILEIVTDSEKKRELNIAYVLAGVVFQNLSNATELPSQTSYKIRMNFTTSMSSYLLRDIAWRPGPENSDWYLNDLKYGYIFLQDMVERALIHTYTNSTRMSPGGYIQPFPYPCFVFNTNLLIGQLTIPLILTAGSILTISLLARAVVQERERRLSEVMSVLGVGVLEHWASWLFVYYMLLLLPSLLAIAVLRLGSVLPRSSLSLLALAQLSYNLALLPLGILLSLPFKRATVAASTVGLVYFLFYFLVILVQVLEFRVPPVSIVISQLLAPTALGLFLYHTVQFELRGVGINWSNVGTSPLDQGFSTPAISWGCMLVDAVLYSLLALYLHAVLPGSYGKRHPWYFLFSPAWWLGDRRWRRVRHYFSRDRQYELVSSEVEEVLLEEIQFVENSAPIWEPLAREREPEQLVRGVSMSQVGKVYSWGLLGLKRKVALHSVSLNLFEGQITVLLGHNGAGKTSLMMILSGINRPTSGSVQVYHECVDSARDSIGLCPQHNILFAHLTVQEHMNFYGSLRGLAAGRIKLDSEKLLKCMQLAEHENKRVDKLSGGMARKLSVSLAFLGSPKVVILDEPTTGVDPVSRRHIWDFLLSERENRCILLSTHQMEEAEVLGDRIAMIDHGHLLCVGSLPFLKSNFGLNYLLNVEKQQAFDDVIDRDALDRLLTDGASGLTAVKETDQEIHYSLSTSCLTGDDDSLTLALAHLELNKDSLHVSSYGLTAPSLEQLFLMLTESRYSEDSCDDVVPDCTQALVAISRPNPFNLVLLHSYALFLKRFNHTRRDLTGLLLQYVPFLSAITLAMTLTVIYSVSGVPPDIRYYPGMYLSLTSPQFFFLAAPDYPSDAEAFLSTIPCPGGLGVPPGFTAQACPPRANSSTHPGSIQCSYCPSNPVWHRPLSNQTAFSNASCNCAGGYLSCPPEPSPLPLEALAEGDGSTLQDLRGRNVSEYLTRTFNEFVLNRYQGVSFGHVREDMHWVNSTMGTDRFGVKNYSKAWFSFKGFRAMTSSLNVMNNAILRRELRDHLGYSRNFTRYGIIGNSQLWPLTPFQRAYAEITSGKPMLVSFMMFFGFCFLVAFSVVFVLEEKVSGTRHLQELSGLSKIVYWTVSFLYDIMTYCIAVLLALIIMAAFQYWPFVSRTHLPTFLLASLGFGLTSISLLHLVSRLFRSPSLAYVVLACCTFLLGLCALVVVFSLDIRNERDSRHLTDALKNTLVFLPQFSFPYILYNLIILYYYELEQEEVGFSIGQPISNPLEWDPIGKSLVILYTQFILTVLLSVSIIFLSDLRQRFGPKCVHKPVGNELPGDSDVEDEMTRVLAESNTSQYSLTLHRISKRYTALKKYLYCRLALSRITTVDDVTFAVRKECFGLLGPNGAGKTTIFDSITGIRSLTRGTIRVHGLDVCRCRKEANRNMSYCPQFDSLFGHLTAREQLSLFARLRGMHGSELGRVVRETLRRVHIQEYADTPVNKYSGGNKRKLQTGIALLSQPSLLLLDEPTAGIDPYAKQFLWQLLREVTQGGVSSLVTTHSMSECEALCSRIAIIDRGRLRCIGSPQHLKAKYGKGYILKLYLSPLNSPEAVATKISEKLSYPVTQLESHQSLLTFHLDREFSLSAVLSLLTEMKRENKIADFSLGQTTLEDVFLRITETAEAERNVNTLGTPNVLDAQLLSTN